MIDITRYEVPAEKLKWVCDPVQFEFECTEDLAPLHEFIGQDRAIRAIEFGLSMEHDGYNIYLAGLTSTGWTSVAKTYIARLIDEREKAGQQYRVNDWCYIYNFAHPDRPRSVVLPKGNGRVFRDDVANLLQHLRKDLLKAFSSEEYKEQRKAIVEESQARQQEMFNKLRSEAAKKGFLIQMSQVGAALVPLKDGKALSQEDFMALGERARKTIEKNRNDLRKDLESLFEEAQDIDRSPGEKLLESIAASLTNHFPALRCPCRKLRRVSGYPAVSH